MSDNNRQAKSYSILDIAQRHSTEWKGNPRTKGVPFLKKHASPAFLAKDINEVTHQAFQEELDRYCLGRPAQHNGNRLKENFNSLMKFAVMNGYRTKPYHSFGCVRGVSQTNQVLSSEEVERFLFEIDRSFREDFMVRIAARALVLLGLHLSEASSFDLNKIDFDRWRYIQADARGRLRYIPIPSPMRPLLIHMAGQTNPHPTESKPWFHTIDLQQLVRSVGSQCGLPGLSTAVLTRTAIYGVRKA
jgi:integrase